MRLFSKHLPIFSSDCCLTVVASVFIGVMTPEFPFGIAKISAGMSGVFFDSNIGRAV